MKRSSYAALAALLVATVLTGADPAAGQNAAHNHIGHVTDAWNDTPDGQGLLPTAIAEAEIAARHAGLAAGDPSNFAAMKRHTAHVLHAVDPEQIENGPGLGYGVKQAAAGAARHITAAADSEGASNAVRTHANHVATSAQNTVARADDIVMLAKRIARTTTAADAAPLVAELNALAQALTAGVDADGDGRTGWQEGEGGLEVAQTHADLLKNAEGL